MIWSIQQKIIDFLSPVSGSLGIADVRIGLGYTSVRLDNGAIGVAWTARVQSGNCPYEPRAGTLSGRSALDLLEMLAEPAPLSRSIGLATANALAAGMHHPDTTSVNVLDLINIQSSDHLVMVGFFGPLVPRIQETGCQLDILELERDIPCTMSPEEGRESLAACTIAIITATSIVTGTIDELFTGLGNPRAAVILGPSSFMRPEVFEGTPVTHIGGVWVRDPQAVEQIISEGGGIKSMKRYMDLRTICLKSCV